jgi:hypothetical protein
MTERREIPGTPGYSISSDGRVWSQWKPIGRGYGKGWNYEIGPQVHEVKPETTQSGHKRVRLRTADGQTCNRSVNRLLADIWSKT